VLDLGCSNRDGRGSAGRGTLAGLDRRVACRTSVGIDSAASDRQPTRRKDTRCRPTGHDCDWSAGPSSQWNPDRGRWFIDPYDAKPVSRLDPLRDIASGDGNDRVLPGCLLVSEAQNSALAVGRAGRQRRCVGILRNRAEAQMERQAFGDDSVGEWWFAVRLVRESQQRSRFPESLSGRCRWLRYRGRPTVIHKAARKDALRSGDCRGEIVPSYRRSGEASWLRLRNWTLGNWPPFH